MAKVLTFSQQKGGAGKTTLLTQLAVTYAAGGAGLGSGKNVALIDLDPQRTLTSWMDERIRRTGEADLDLIESSEWRVGADIDKAARNADLIMIDCPGAADILLNRVFRATDLVIAPTQPSAPDVWATRATLRAAAKQGAEARVVLNRVPPRGAVVEEMAELLEAEGAELIGERIGNRIAFSNAFAKGGAVTEMGGASKASDEIRALAVAIQKLIA